MTSTLQLNFSHRFSGRIWSLLSVAKKNLLFIEIRDEVNFQVKFFALDYCANQFLWEALTLKESWWVGLKAAHNDTLLFQRYLSKGNPDRQSLIALDIFSKTVRWEVEEFSFYDWDDTTIFGYQTRNDIEPAVVDCKTGEVTAIKWERKQIAHDTGTKNPVQFLEGTPHFSTVKSFIAQKTQYAIVRGVDYLELGNWIIVSTYIEGDGSLANYLLVFNRQGALLMSENLGEKLQGLGTDTFFVLSGCLFFVKNKSELVAYRLYD